MSLVVEFLPSASSPKFERAYNEWKNLRLDCSSLGQDILSTVINQKYKEKTGSSNWKKSFLLRITGCRG